MALEMQKTADGFDAVVLGELVYAAVPKGQVLVLHWAFHKDRPVSGMTVDRFLFDGSRFEDREGFLSHMEELAAHRSHVARLGRVEVDSRTRTPWGVAQGGTVYDKGVVFYSTPGHGGFKVGKRMNAVIPDAYRNEDGWYEEDCEWAKVAAGLPHLFTDREKRNADETLRNWFPDEYETVNGVELPEGASLEKDRRAFERAHANDWLVISASTMPDGRVKCIATVGGERGGWKDGVETTPEEKTFAVPAEEYARRGRFHFVIDPDRHEELAAPGAPRM